MSKYDIDLDYVIYGIDITREELEDIKAEADRIILNDKESKGNRAVAYLKKAQCLRKFNFFGTLRIGSISYDEIGFFSYNEAGINIETEDLKILLKNALELSPNMPEAFMQLGLINSYFFGIEGFQDEAKYYFTRAIQLKPDYAAAYNNRALIFERTTIDPEGKENIKSAVADLTEAIRIRPFDAIYHLNRAAFHSKLGEHKEAVEDFSKAIDYASDALKDKLETYDFNIFKLRGKEYLELNEYSKAIDDFSASLRLVSGDDGTLLDNDTLLLRAKAYYFSGVKDKTKEVFEEYLKRKRNDADTESRKKFFELTGLKPEDIL
jgi:tetratricopeptide (TPR) repeat protein